MSNLSDEQHFTLAMYILKNRIKTPWDLVKYWGFSGPCDEAYPSIERIDTFDRP